MIDSSKKITFKSTHVILFSNLFYNTTYLQKMKPWKGLKINKREKLDKLYLLIFFNMLSYFNWNKNEKFSYSGVFGIGVKMRVNFYVFYLYVKLHINDIHENLLPIFSPIPNTP